MAKAKSATKTSSFTKFKVLTTVSPKTKQKTQPKAPSVVRWNAVVKVGKKSGLISDLRGEFKAKNLPGSAMDELRWLAARGHVKLT